MAAITRVTAGASATVRLFVRACEPLDGPFDESILLRCTWVAWGAMAGAAPRVERGERGEQGVEKAELESLLLRLVLLILPWAWWEGNLTGESGRRVAFWLVGVVFAGPELSREAAILEDVGGVSVGVGAGEKADLVAAVGGGLGEPLA